MVDKHNAFCVKHSVTPKYNISAFLKGRRSTMFASAPKRVVRGFGPLLLWFWQLCGSAIKSAHVL